MGNPWPLAGECKKDFNQSQSHIVALSQPLKGLLLNHGLSFGLFFFSLHTYAPLFQQKISFPSISFEEEYPEQYAYKGKDDESLRIFQHLLWLKMRSSYQIFTISGVDNSLSKNLNYITMKCTLAQSMRIKSLRRVVVQKCVLFIPVHRTLLLLQSCQKIYSACETAGLLPVHTLQTLSLLQGCPV